jgi:Ca2+-transporting ATPase
MYSRDSSGITTSLSSLLSVCLHPCLQTHAYLRSVVAGQILIVEVGGAAFTVTRLYGRDWGITIVVGFLSIPLGALVRLLPTAPFERFLIKCHVYRDPTKLPLISPDAEDEEMTEKYDYNDALSKVRDNLYTYSSIRGGRLRASSIVSKSRSARLREADIRL